MDLWKIKISDVVDGINEAEDEVRASQTDDEVVARLTQLRMSHHGPNKHTITDNP